VIRHNEKCEQFHPPVGLQVVKTVNQNSLDVISLEKMCVLDCICGNEVEIIGVEIGFD
jgi:hypothetical protein